MIKFNEFKKTLAGFLAMAMVFSPIVTSTAFAADATTDPASGSVSNNGSTEGFVKEEAFSVVLPTISDNSLAFKLDPQGLLKVSGNDAKFNTVEAGDIVFINKISTNNSYGDFNKSNVIYATNKSSYDVKFSVDVSMTKGTSTNQVTFVSNNAAVSGNSALNVYVAAVPETNYISYNDVSGNSFAAISSNASSVAFPLDSDGNASLAYKIPGISSNYTVSKNGISYNYVQKPDATGWKSVGFTLTGSCNPTADWSDFDAEKTELDLELSWTLTRASGTEQDYVSANNPAGLIVDVPAIPDATPTTLTYSLASGTGVSFVCAKTPVDVAVTLFGTNYSLNGIAGTSTAVGADLDITGNTVSVTHDLITTYEFTAGTTLNVVVFYDTDDLTDSTVTAVTIEN